MLLLLVPSKSVSTGAVDVEVTLLVSEDPQVFDNIRDYFISCGTWQFFFLKKKMRFQNCKFKVLRQLIMDLSGKIVKHPPPPRNDSFTESGSEHRMLWSKYLASDPDPASRQHGHLFSHFSVLQWHMSPEDYLPSSGVNRCMLSKPVRLVLGGWGPKVGSSCLHYPLSQLSRPLLRLKKTYTH